MVYFSHCPLQDEPKASGRQVKYRLAETLFGTRTIQLLLPAGTSQRVHRFPESTLEVLGPTGVAVNHELWQLIVAKRHAALPNLHRLRS